MQVRAPRRGRGDRFETGEIKRKILLYTFNYPEGKSEPDIRDFLRTASGIVEKKGITSHLSGLAKKTYIVKNPRKKGFENFWCPTHDIAIFKILWRDLDNLLRINNDDEYKLALLSTKQGNIFIQNDLAPACLDLHYEQVFKTNKLFSNLPSKITSEDEREKLRKICIWACQSCPTLVSHLFRPNKEILLCICMVLYNKLQFEESEFKPSESIKMPNQVVPKDYFRIIQQLQDNWKNIRFSKDVSKETISILTMMVSIFSFNAKYPALSTKIFQSDQFDQLWNLFVNTISDSKKDDATVQEAVRMMFTLTYANKIFT